MPKIGLNISAEAAEQLEKIHLQTGQTKTAILNDLLLSDRKEDDQLNRMRSLLRINAKHLEILYGAFNNFLLLFAPDKVEYTV